MSHQVTSCDRKVNRTCHDLYQSRKVQDHTNPYLREYWDFQSHEDNLWGKYSKLITLFCVLPKLTLRTEKYITTCLL